MYTLDQKQTCIINPSAPSLLIFPRSRHILLQCACLFSMWGYAISALPPPMCMRILRIMLMLGFVRVMDRLMCFVALLVCACLIPCTVIQAACVSAHVNILARKHPNLFPFPGNYTD